jgi:hypothetical protein
LVIVLAASTPPAFLDEFKVLCYRGCSIKIGGELRASIWWWQVRIGWSSGRSLKKPFIQPLE